VVSKACDAVAKLLMPIVAVAVLALWGPAVGGPHVAMWSVAAVVSAAAGALVVNALCGRARPLLRLVAAVGRWWDAFSTAPTGWSAAAGRR
jgi:hypothetical protein